MADTTLKLDQVEDLAFHTLICRGASQQLAASVVRSPRPAARDGGRSHVLMHVPTDADHLRCGKALSAACPSRPHARPLTIQVNAAHPFAHLAIDAGWSQLDATMREQRRDAEEFHTIFKTSDTRSGAPA